LAKEWALALLRRKLADCDYLSCAFKSLLCAAKFVVHQRHLESESGRLGMNAMAASDHGRELVFPGLDGDSSAQFFDILEKNVCRLNICTAKAVSMMSLLVRPK